MWRADAIFAGNSGEWKFIARESSEDNFLFVREAAAKGKAAAKCKVASAKSTTAEAKPVTQKRKKAPASMAEAGQATTRRTRQAAKQ